MIWLAVGMSVTFWLGYKAAAEYAAISPAITAAKGFGAMFHNPSGPSSAGTNNGKATQSQ